MSIQIIVILNNLLCITLKNFHGEFPKYMTPTQLGEHPNFSLKGPVIKYLRGGAGGNFKFL